MARNRKQRSTLRRILSQTWAPGRGETTHLSEVCAAAEGGLLPEHTLYEIEADLSGRIRIS